MIYLFNYSKKIWKKWRKLKHEIWTHVNGFEGFYQISNQGRLRSLDRLVFHSGNGQQHLIQGKVLETRINNCGYVSVRLNKYGKTYTRFIHRLMALAFIPHPLQKKYINHRNGMKTDNHLENLEWVTMSENMLHAYQIGLIRRRKPSLQSYTIKKIYRANHYD